MEFFKAHWWKSNYKLPVSFIVFFVLTFFLIGEQLPALPIYLFGPGIGNSGDKVHILDLSPTDALHRPIVYLLLGIIIWLLFRKFAWPIAWIIVAIIAILEQFFLTPSDHRPPTTLLSALTILIAMGVFTLVPYFIYRAVDRKWGGQGKRNAILIALAINLLLLGFFVLQIYALHNSYHYLLKKEFFGQQNQPGLSNQKTYSDPKSNTTIPSYSCPDALETRKDLPTLAVKNGAAREIGKDEQDWIAKNCNLLNH